MIAFFWKGASFVPQLVQQAKDFENIFNKFSWIARLTGL